MSFHMLSNNGSGWLREMADMESEGARCPDNLAEQIKDAIGDVQICHRRLEASQRKLDKLLGEVR